MKLASVPNFFPFILITDRNGELNPALADERVRQAIAYSIDRDAYNDAIHAGRADPSGGIYPSNFSQFHWPEFDDLFAYDPDRARSSSPKRATATVSPSRCRLCRRSHRRLN